MGRLQSHQLEVFPLALVTSPDPSMGAIDCVLSERNEQRWGARGAFLSTCKAKLGECSVFRRDFYSTASTPAEWAPLDE